MARTRVEGFPELSAALDAWCGATTASSEEVRRLLRDTLEAVQQDQFTLRAGHRGGMAGSCSHPVARAFDRVTHYNYAYERGVLEPVGAVVLLRDFGSAKDPPAEDDSVETQLVAGWLESLKTEVPPPEPEYIPPPLTEDELVLDLDANPGLAAALKQWTATTTDATWPEQCGYWFGLVKTVETGNGMTPKDGGPPILQAFSNLAHELWLVGKAKLFERPPFREQRLNETVGRVGAMIMLRNFGSLKDHSMELPPIPDTASPQ